MSTNLHGGVLLGLLMSCLIFASFEIYNDTLGSCALEAAMAEVATAQIQPRSAVQASPNTGYLVFYSEVHPKTNQRRDKLGFYMKQPGADESFFGAADHDHRLGVTKALDDLFSSAQSMGNRVDASSPLMVNPL